MKKLSTLILTAFTLSVMATTALASGNEYRDSRSDSDDDRYEYTDSDRYRDDDRGEYGKNYREHERGEKGDRYKDDDDRSSRFSEGENEFYGTIKLWTSPGRFKGGSKRDLPERYFPRQKDRNQRLNKSFQRNRSDDERQPTRVAVHQAGNRILPAQHRLPTSAAF